MRKLLVTGLSFLALTGLGGVSENNVQEQSQELNSNYKNNHKSLTLITYTS